ncbi:MAG: glucokinase, partial [Rhodospirillaceae bacterium]
MARPDNPLPDATADMPPGLIADIGGTNARFALANALGGIRDERVLACKDHAGPLEAAQAYLAAIGYDGPPPLRAAFCVA